MTSGLNAIRHKFLECLDKEESDQSILDSEITLFSENGSDTARVCQVSVHYPQMIYGNLDDSFPRSIMENCNDMLVAISGGNQESPPHKGGWVNENHLIEDKMINISYDVEIRKLSIFANELYKVIYTIQSQLKQQAVYVRIDDDKIHADVLKRDPSSYPSPDSFKATHSDLQGEIHLEDVRIGQIKIGKLSINDDSFGTVIANLLQISGGF